MVACCDLPRPSLGVPSRAHPPRRKHVGGEPMAVFGDRILRCSDGHLFVSSESSRLFGSIHMGPFRKMQCPVDGKIVTCGNVREASLTPEQLEEARRYKT